MKKFWKTIQEVDEFVEQNGGDVMCLLGEFPFSDKTEQMIDVAIKADEDVVSDSDLCDYIIDCAHKEITGEEIKPLVYNDEIEVRITFRTEVYIKGRSINEIRNKWEDLPLYSEHAIEECHAEFVELVSAERVDDESYDDIRL